MVGCRFDVQLSADIYISAVTARRKVNGFLASQVGNLLLADDASLTIGERITWRVPVDLTAPGQGRIGRVGDIDVDIDSGELLLNQQQLEKLRANALRINNKTSC